MTALPRGGIRLELELERRGGPGAPWRLINDDVVYRGDSAGGVLEELAGDLDAQEAADITDELRREAGGLHIVGDEELDELERMTDPRTPDEEDHDGPR